MSVTRNNCNCPDISIGMLPVIICREAYNGNTEKVLEWLRDGGDINATDLNFKTLVHIASEKNHVHLLKELLKFPDVHLNQGTTLSSENVAAGATPILLAMDNDNIECVDALLNSPSKCKINLIEKMPSTCNALRRVVNQLNWKMIERLFSAGLVLEKNEATFIYDVAAKVNKGDVVKTIIDKGFPLNYAAINNIGFIVLYANNWWDSVNAERVLQKCLQNENYMGLIVLEAMADKKDFSTVENILKMLVPNVEINIKIANAIFGKELVDIEKSLAEEELKEGVIEGAILIAAIAGSTEEIAEKLFCLMGEHHKDFFKYALLLAAIFNRTELYPLVLADESISFSTLCSALQISTAAKGRGTTLIERALKRKSKKTVRFLDDDDDHDEVCGEMCTRPEKRCKS